MKKLFTLFTLGFTLLANAQDGLLDASYGKSGIVQTTENHSANAIAIQSDGKIIIAGMKFDANGVDYGVFRLGSDGKVDLSFGTNSTAIIDFFNKTDEARGVAILPNGKIVVAGIVTEGTSRKIGLLKLNSDGSVDNNFGTSGKVVTAISGATSIGIDVFKVLSSGKMILGGTADGFSKALLVMYEADGSLDTKFDTDGILQTSIVQNIQSMAIQSDGKIIVGGTASLKVIIGRLETDGSLDKTFGTNGLFATSALDLGSPRVYVDVLSNGKIVCAFGTVIAINTEVSYLRLTSAGVLDSDFGTSGTGTFNVVGNDYPSAIKAMPSGKIIVIGSTYTNSSTTDGFIARINEDGKMDNNFGTSGVTKTSVRADDIDNFVALAIQNDGKIVVVGNQCGGSCRYTSARYNASESNVSVEHNIKVKTIGLIYPNPSNHTIHFNDLDLNGAIEVKIIALDGTVIKEEIITQSSVNISELTNGLYFIYLTNSNGTTKIGKFIKA